MAISVAQNPIGTQGAGGRGFMGLGDCVFRVTSSSLAQPNFKFFVQVYDVATLVAEFVIARVDVVNNRSKVNIRTARWSGDGQP